jgi:hypothetical protein
MSGCSVADRHGWCLWVLRATVPAAGDCWVPVRTPTALVFVVWSLSSWGRGALRGLLSFWWPVGSFGGACLGGLLGYWQKPTLVRALMTTVVLLGAPYGLTSLKASSAPPDLFSLGCAPRLPWGRSLSSCNRFELLRAKATGPPRVPQDGWLRPACGGVVVVLAQDEPFQGDAC